MVSRRPVSIEGVEDEPAYVEEEQLLNPTTLKDRQVRMEQQVYRIWTCVAFNSFSFSVCVDL